MYGASWWFPGIALRCFPGATPEGENGARRDMLGSRITKRTVDALKATGAEYVAWDGDIAGFGVRVRPSGAKTYIVQYRAGAGRKAPTRKLTLGAVGKLTPDEARDLARKAVGSVAHGADPAGKRAEDRKGLDGGGVGAVFLTDHVEAKRRAGTARHYRDILERIVIPALGNHQGRSGEPVRRRQAAPEMEADALSGQPDRGGGRQHVRLRRQARAGPGGA